MTARLTFFLEDPELRGWKFVNGPWWRALHLGRFTLMYLKRFPGDPFE